MFATAQSLHELVGSLCAPAARYDGHMFRFTIADWAKTAAIALTVLLLALLWVAIDSRSDRSNSKWRFLRRGLENIDSEMKKRDEAIKELNK